MGGITSVAGQLGIAAGFFVALMLVLRWVSQHFEKMRIDTKEFPEERIGCA